MVGVAGALSAMRDFGFQTFDKFWDESYDEIEDPKMRLYKIVEVCKYIGSWTPEQIIDFKRRVKPILEHNYKVVQSNSALKVANRIRTEIAKRVR